MASFISFGKFDSNYKYMLFFIIAELFDQYLFQKDILEKLGFFERTIVQDHKIIVEMCNYIGILIFSIILLIYEKYLQKTNNNNNNDKNELLTVNHSKNIYLKSLIYNNQLSTKTPLLKVIFIFFLVFVVRQLLVSFYKCGLSGLDFWMFEMLFIYVISSKVMGDPVYKHQTISVFLVIILSGLMKWISLMFIFFDSSERIYKTYYIFIPIGLIIFLSITCIRAYTSCKIKMLMDLKYISSNKLLVIYGAIGTIICALTCLITTFAPCGDTIISYDEMIKICTCKKAIKSENENSNKTINYYDSFIIHSEKVFKGDGLNIFKNICLIIIKIIVIYFVNLFSILILKYLNPLFFICARYIYYFIVHVINFIVSLIKGVNIENGSYLDFFSEFVGILGILIYIEFLELNFCNLNYNLKRNIIQRSGEDAPYMTLIPLNEITDINQDDNSSTNTEKAIYE